MSTGMLALDRLGRLGASATDSRQLREDVLGELRRTIPFDAWVWALTDPVTKVGVAPVAHVPAIDQLPETIRRRYQTGATRWTVLARRRRTAARLSTIPHPTEGDERWRQFLAGYGIVDVASVVFADRFGTWAFLDLWRTTLFTDVDELQLGALPAALTTALRTTVADTFEVPPPPAAGERDPVVLLLGDDLRIQSETPLSTTWLGQLLPPPPGRPPVPASVYNVGAQLLAVEQGCDAHPPSASVHLADGLWVTLRAARLSSAGGEAGHKALAVTIDQATPDTRRELFGRAHGLTAREREILALLAEGGDTQELARRLTLSAYTVQDHVKAILAKTGAATRQVLLARATGR